MLLLQNVVTVRLLWMKTIHSVSADAEGQETTTAVYAAADVADAADVAASYR